MKTVTSLIGCLFLLVGISMGSTIYSNLSKLSIATPVERVELYGRILGGVFIWFVGCLCLIAGTAPVQEKGGALRSPGEDGQPAARQPFAVAASGWGLVAIFVAFGFFLWESFLFREPNRLLSRFCWSALVVGLGFSVIGLNGTRIHRDGGLLAKSVIGVVFGGLFLWIFTSLHDLNRNLHVGRQLAAAMRQQDAIAGSEMIEMETAAQTDPSMNSEQILRTKENIATAIEESTGDSKRLMKALAAWLERLQGVNAEIAAAVASLGQVLEFSAVQSREDLATQRDLVKQFLDILARTQRFAENSVLALRNEMVKEGLHPTLADRAASQFRRELNPDLLAMKLQHSTNQRWATNVLALIRHLESHWGSWSHDKSSDQLRFSNAAVAKEFNRLSARLERELPASRPPISMGK